MMMVLVVEPEEAVGVMLLQLSAMAQCLTAQDSPAQTDPKAGVLTAPSRKGDRSHCCHPWEVSLSQIPLPQDLSSQTQFQPALKDHCYYFRHPQVDAQLYHLKPRAPVAAAAP